MSDANGRVGAVSPFTRARVEMVHFADRKAGVAGVHLPHAMETKQPRVGETLLARPLPSPQIPSASLVVLGVSGARAFGRPAHRDHAPASFARDHGVAGVGARGEAGGDREAGDDRVKGLTVHTRLGGRKSMRSSRGRCGGDYESTG